MLSDPILAIKIILAVTIPLVLLLLFVLKLKGRHFIKKWDNSTVTTKAGTYNWSELKEIVFINMWVGPRGPEQRNHTIEFIFPNGKAIVNINMDETYGLMLLTAKNMNVAKRQIRTAGFFTNKDKATQTAASNKTREANDYLMKITKERLEKESRQN